MLTNDTSTSQNQRVIHREGEKVWCPDPRNVWQLGTVVEDDGERLHVVSDETGEEQAFSIKETHPFDPSHALDLNNVAEMDNLHQAPLLDLLRRRYLQDKIYTYTGDILISINPYKNIPLLYNFPDIKSISKLENPAPHVYSVAHGAYYAMIKEGKCQSILVSGESGAGKTEASKYIMRYLANISTIGGKRGRSGSMTRNGKSNRSSTVEQCVLQSNPILEAFGNAKTIRNDNSSRFGKFIKIYYNEDGRISGASTSHFLLEKSRIVGCAESERNYHIFYQIFAGLSIEEKKKFFLNGSAQEYFYLNQGKCISCKEINDKKDFKKVIQAMKTIGIEDKNQQNIFRLIAIVLHLGNLCFQENLKLEAECVDKKAIETLSKLLQVKAIELEFALTKRTMSAGTRGSIAEISLTALEAEKSRNGLAKEIFSKIFDWLVNQINFSSTQEFVVPFFTNIEKNPSCMSIKMKPTTKYIGILDIFGFEILTVNSFEQLCINYTNEMLQQQFNEFVFLYEKNIYHQEKIDFCSKFHFFQEKNNNTLCLELIDKKPLGILPLLDEQAMLGRKKASDDKFIQKLHQIHLGSKSNCRNNHQHTTSISTNNNSMSTNENTNEENEKDENISQNQQEQNHLYYSKPRFSDNQFIIHHYAGQVTYTVTGFLDKNNDSLHQDLLSLMTSSTCEFTQQLFCPLVKKEDKKKEEEENDSSTSNTTIATTITEAEVSTTLTSTAIARSGRKLLRKNPTTNKMTGTMTVGRKFRDQMADLMVEIKATSPSFIRCVKPNHLRFPQGWNAFLILNQLIYLGVMETVRIRRSGFPIRRLFQEFYEKYQLLLRYCPHKKKNTNKTLPSELLSPESTAIAPLPTTKALCKLILEKFIERKHWQLGLTKVFLKDGQLFLLDNQILFLQHHAAIQIQKIIKTNKQRRFFLLKKRSIVKLQATIRMKGMSQKYLQKRQQIIFLQAWIRCWIQSQQYRRVQKGIIFLQAKQRGILAKKKKNFLQKAPKASIIIQSLIRGFVCRMKWKKIKHGILVLKNVFFMKKTRRCFLRQRQAACLIEANIKCFLTRRQFIEKQKAAIKIHAITRGFIIRLKFGKKAREKQKKQKNAQIQMARMIRGFVARKKYQKAIRRIIMFQARIRANKIRMEYLKGRKATINSQAMIRRALVRRKFLQEKKMATRMEAFGRMILAKSKYQQKRQQIILLQNLWRMQKFSKKFLNTKKKIILIQKNWKMYIEHKKFHEIQKKIIFLQAFTRKFIQQKKFKQQKQAIRTICHSLQGFLQRQKFLFCQKKIVKIQSILRVFLNKRLYLQKRVHIIQLQSFFRQKKAKRLAQLRRNAIARVVCVIRIFVTRIRMKKMTKELFLAANENNLIEILQLSQEVPGMLRIRDREQDMMSLVHVAARNGDLNLARYVLEEIPQMEDMVFGKDANGNTPLHFASAIAHLDMVKFLAKIANQNAAPSPGGGNNANFSLANFLRSSESRSNDSDFDCPESSRTVNSNSSPKSIIGVTDEPKGPTPPVAAATGRMRNASIASADLAGPLRDSITTSGGRRSRANTVRRSLVTTPSTGRRLTNTMLSSGLGTTSVQMNIYKEGFLKKASGNRLATKRYVMVDEASLSYYKTPKDKIPLMIMELCDATIKRITQIEHCFEIASPRLKSNRNPEGILSFVAESEGEVHDWMATIRKVPGVRIATKNPPYQNMICIDSGLRREYVNMKNKAGYTPLHLAVQNDDEGFDAVKTAVWLIENGAEVNAKDNVGDTALHFAVMLHRDDLVETLMKKGADSSIQNAKGLTPIDISIEEETRVLLDPNHLLAKTKQRPFVLLTPPVRLPDSTYVSVFLGAAAVASGPIMETPYFKLSILDAKSNIVETSQMTPNSLIQDGVSFMWYGNTWYIQTPLEHLKEGCVAVFELMYYNYQSDKDEVGCFTFFRLDLGKITSAPVTFEMYAPPTDPFSQYLARIPGDSFFQAEINVSL